MSMSQILAKVGYDVRSAEDGFSALFELRKELPDILLTDLNMPGMSGFELLSVVRHRFPAMRTIAMSGAFSGREVPSGVAADAFYQKGRSVGFLLSILGAMPRVHAYLPNQPSAAFEPIWVQPKRLGNFEESNAMISCPECLRTFSHDLGGSNRLMRKADCIYCGSLIRYAIVQPPERAPVQIFQKSRAEKRPESACLPQLNY
jgi:CheY-like chemotaxis protein